MQVTQKGYLAPHQVEAVDGAIATLATEARCQVIMACGTGKTRVGVSIALELNTAHAIVFLPSLALIRQTLPEWIKAPFEGGFDFLCVCSDTTVAETDEVRVSPEEIEAEFGAGKRLVTTNADDVRQFLAAGGRRKVIFATYHSADVVSDAIPERFCFDFGLYDEAHRTAGKNSMFNASLQDNHTPIERRVFMTATPKHSDYRHRDKDGEAHVVFSMSDASVYGKVAYKLPIREAITRGIITDYKILISVITDRMMADSFAERGLRKPDNADQLDLGVHALAISNAMEQYGLHKAVSFHNSVRHAHTMADPQVQGFPADLQRFHVSGSQPTSERRIALEHFARATTSLVTNARCLTEGVDVPEIDLVTFVHPKKSRVDIVQAVGRALRKSRSGEKDCGYILLPLFVHESTKTALEEVLKESGYETLWQTIQALREQDEALDEGIREGVMTGSVRGLERFVLVNGDVSKELDGLIGTVCLDELGESWDAYYGVLRREYESGRDANVAVDAIIDGLKVGAWLSRQRVSYLKGTLSTDRIARLEAIGIVWDPLAEQWEKHLAVLKRLFDEGGDANVPGDTIIDGLKVGAWLANQRNAYKQGILSPNLIVRLEAIGIVWDQLAAQWEKNYAVLKRLFDEGGDANVAQGTVIDGLSVGNWLSAQRVAYNKGTLSPDRIARLEAIGIVWDPLAAQWEKYYAVLKRLFDEGGDANVAQGTVIDGLKVGAWLNTQRNNYKNGTLSPDRIARLETIGIVWDPFAAQWEKYYAVLKQLFDEGGDANVPVRAIIDGLKVGAWLSQQRNAYKKGILSPDRIARLEAIGIVLSMSGYQKDAGSQLGFDDSCGFGTQTSTPSSD